MLINSHCVAAAPSRVFAEPSSRRVAAAGSREPADFGRGAVVRVRPRAGLACSAGWMTGIGSASGMAAVGYRPGNEGSFRLGQVTAGPVQTSVTKQIHSSTDNHNSIQAIRLVPATGGAVGPHPVREPGPA